jgi:hypothetical protein
LPGKNLLPAQDPKTVDQFGTPYEARLGGSETMYPEYIKKLGPFPPADQCRPRAARSVVSEPSTVDDGADTRRPAGDGPPCPSACIRRARKRDPHSPGPAWAWRPAIPTVKPGDVEVLHVRGNVYMLLGAGGNITLQKGSDGGS